LKRSTANHNLTNAFENYKCYKKVVVQKKKFGDYQIVNKTKLKANFIAFLIVGLLLISRG
jgi:hypothetical protein